MKQKAYISFLIFGVIWTLRCIYRFYFPNIYTDTLLLWETVENYEYLGKIIHSPIPGVHQGSSSVPLTVLPRGYVYLLWAFNQVFSTSRISTLVIDCSAIGLWGWATLSLLKRDENTYPVSAYLFVFYLIFTPTLLHPLPATDLLCLALLTSCIAILGKEPRACPTWHILLVGLLLVICGWIRFAYIPFMWLFPAVFGLYVLRRKALEKTWPSLLYLLTFPVLFSLYTLLNPHPFPFLGENQNRLFWNHLAHMDPFPLKALFYFNPSHLSWLAEFSSLPEKFWEILGSILSTGILILVLRFWWIGWKKEGEWRQLLFLGIVGVNVGVLIYMSLTTPPETDWLPFWTFVMETRYYAPSQYVIILSLLYLASNSYKIWTESQER